MYITDTRYPLIVALQLNTRFRLDLSLSLRRRQLALTRAKKLSCERQLTRIERLRRELALSRSNLLLLCLNYGRTSAHLANLTNNDAQKIRSAREARKVYDAVLHFFAASGIKQPTKGEIRERLDALKSRLEALGETL